MPREWDATTYDELTLPHVEWGQRVLDQLELAGTELVLDAGCGTGRDAVALRERWPEVRLVALDGSQQMLDVAREHLGDDQVTYLHADLTQPLPVAELVDAVMSVAAFHWITDHAALFANLAGVMRPGARLVFDCGGLGNVRNLSAAISAVTGRPADDWEFADDIGTRERLTAAGFDVLSARLRPSPFRCDDPDVFESYLAAVCLGGQLASMPESDHADFVRQVRLAFSEPVVDYVRLEAVALRR